MRLLVTKVLTNEKLGHSACPPSLLLFWLGEEFGVRLLKFTWEVQSEINQTNNVEREVNIK